ncbi:hypothetical protein ACFXHD_13775 [Streptomyces hydrogenans]|uniref:hypothetical protein n=1 Tax=Streptomyces hydrogenans TaxID=1873719 RepID=UPI00369B8973
MTRPVPGDPFVPKGEPRPLDGQTCGYKPSTATDACGTPGTWHVMWDRDPCDNSITCDEHMQFIQRRWVYDDRHPMGADCTMPGALWEYDTKRCAVPDAPETLRAAADAGQELCRIAGKAER